VRHVLASGVAAHRDVDRPVGNGVGHGADTREYRHRERIERRWSLHRADTAQRGAPALMPGIEQLAQILVLLGEFLVAEDGVGLVDNQRAWMLAAEGTEDGGHSGIHRRQRRVTCSVDDVKQSGFPATFLRTGHH
jgi:hypothetical protein